VGGFGWVGGSADHECCVGSDCADQVGAVGGVGAAPAGDGPHAGGAAGVVQLGGGVWGAAGCCGCGAGGSAHQGVCPPGAVGGGVAAWSLGSLGSLCGVWSDSLIGVLPRQ
jgi:hypothetical protein